MTEALLTLASLVPLALGSDMPEPMTDEELVNLHLSYAYEERLGGFQGANIQPSLLVGMAVFRDRGLLRKARKLVAEALPNANKRSAK